RATAATTEPGNLQACPVGSASIHRLRSWRKPRRWGPKPFAMFHDRARLRAIAGRGGDGSISFRREKYVPKGGPDGGDGGPGGDVALLADPDLRDLSAVRRRSEYKAGRGGHGDGGGRHGATGQAVE